VAEKHEGESSLNKSQKKANEMIREYNKYVPYLENMTEDLLWEEWRIAMKRYLEYTEVHSPTEKNTKKRKFFRTR
jgi:hypothetical protein